MFDIEYSLDVNDPIIEWEITAHKTKEGTFIVGQIVPKKDCDFSVPEIVELLCEKYHLDAIKIYDKFENSDVTGKRDFLRLQNDKCDYYAPCDEQHLFRVSYTDNHISKVAVAKEDLQ